MYHPFRYLPSCEKTECIFYTNSRSDHCKLDSDGGIYFICKQKRALRDLLSLIPKKYPSLAYPSYQILRSLAYFADADADVPPRSITEWDWDEIKKFFEDQVKDLMASL